MAIEHGSDLENTPIPPGANVTIWDRGESPPRRLRLDSLSAREALERGPTRYFLTPAPAPVSAPIRRVAKS